MTAAEFRQKTRIQTKNLHKQNIERACLSADRDDASLPACPTAGGQAGMRVPKNRVPTFHEAHEKNNTQQPVTHRKTTLFIYLRSFKSYHVTHVHYVYPGGNMN